MTYCPKLWAEAVGSVLGFEREMVLQRFGSAVGAVNAE
jgi:hypothetical protein